jgi:acyl-CoA synthetase (AMP-forming)/AMP-acid ligase II
MFIDFMIDVFNEDSSKDFMVWKNQTYSYGWLLQRFQHWQETVDSQNIEPGSVLALEAEFSPNSVALLLAMIESASVIVPLTNAVATQKPDFLATAQCQFSFRVDDNDYTEIKHLPNTANHELYQILRKRNQPGLVLFSSGSTGKPKAAVHDLMGIFDKFRVPRHAYRTISFLLYDHIGGLNTLFYTLANSGCVVTVQDRSPDGVLEAIERHKVDLLPTSPTFLNLILLSEAYKRYDLSSLKLVTYGTEPMPETTLRRFHDLFPNIKLLQTYGLSEVGILRSKSRKSDSLWVRIGGDGFKTRIVDGVLQIKAESAMLGYLNAPSPFTQDGWFNTGDLVEVDGEYIKILGRVTEIINVGGEKVYPAEVESVIQQIENVAEVTVYGQHNPITGNIACANVTLLNHEDKNSFILRLKRYCRERLESFKVPVKVTVIDRKQHTERFKKLRNIGL